MTDRLSTRRGVPRAVMSVFFIASTWVMVACNGEECGAVLEKSVTVAESNNVCVTTSSMFCECPGGLGTSCYPSQRDILTGTVLLIPPPCPATVSCADMGVTCS